MKKLLHNIKIILLLTLKGKGIKFKSLKTIITALIMSFIFINNANAGLGWFSDYAILNVNGSGDAYYWIGSNPSYGTQFDGTNLGNLTGLILDGWDCDYWSDNQDRTGGTFFYQILQKFLLFCIPAGEEMGIIGVNHSQEEITTGDIIQELVKIS